MSSSHYIIVARNDVTGAIELPLDDLTLYGNGVDPDTGEYQEESLVRECAKRYGEDWTICLYGRLGAAYGGSKRA
jgi:hypothetical protein